MTCSRWQVGTRTESPDELSLHWKVDFVSVMTKGELSGIAMGCRRASVFWPSR